MQLIDPKAKSNLLYVSQEAFDQMQKIRTIDAVSVVYGRWQKSGNEKTCSVCKFIYYSNNDDFNYCPNCGAKMHGERKDGEG